MAVLRKKKSLEQPSEETRLTNKHGGKKDRIKGSKSWITFSAGFWKRF